MNKVNNQDEWLFQKLKKYKVVKVSLHAVDRLLHIVESLIAPCSMFHLYIQYPLNDYVEVTFHNQLFALGLLKPRWSFRPEVIVVCRTSTQKKETQTTSIAFDLLCV